MLDKLRPPELEVVDERFAMGVPDRNSAAVKSHAARVSGFIVHSGGERSTRVGLWAYGALLAIIDSPVPTLRRDWGIETKISNRRSSVSNVTEVVVGVSSVL